VKWPSKGFLSQGYISNQHLSFILPSPRKREISVIIPRGENKSSLMTKTFRKTINKSRKVAIPNYIRQMLLGLLVDPNLRVG
jgi:hypothetical protein